jgi:hypothetical protein
LSPVLFSGLIGWAYYRRIRGSFGRQPWRPVRVGVRLAMLALALAGLGMAALFLPRMGLAVGAGLAGGALLAVFALRHTHVELAEGQRWYTPNPWFGGALWVLLLGPLAGRLGCGVFRGGAAAMGQNASPLTLGLGAALVAYYLVNGIGLVLRMRALPGTSPAAPDAQDAIAP